jgi:hypothetical protein
MEERERGGMGILGSVGIPWSWVVRVFIGFLFGGSLWRSMTRWGCLRNGV